MANRRILLKRRKAAANIRKITRTMQLIATAKYQQAYTRAVASKPYTRKLGQLVADISSAAGDAQYPLMLTPETETRSALVTITSDRGLCGGFNINVLREAGEHLRRLEAAGVDSDLYVAGNKGIGYYRFKGQPMDEELSSLGDAPPWETIADLADRLMDRFVAGEITSAHVAFMQFISTGRQRPVVAQILPLAAEAEGPTGPAAGGSAGPAVEYEFSPSPADLLTELLPATVRTRLYQAFMDASVSEQVARMVAMKAATEAAEDMIKRLTQQYNRARQTQITMELLDIVGGANALA